jgi:crotonobetainyl-CoA:carnitine CoA-transferase CaiB-like acyl-CoA transferase
VVEESDGPLDGVRVIDFSRWLAGPFATSILGDMGADVIKVERGSGDGTRNLDRLFAPGLASYFLGLNRSKRSVLIDYRTKAGHEVVLQLVKTADVLVENFRPGVMDSLGLDFETLRGLNSRLVYCSISSFGSTGPIRDKAGMDLIVQAMGGVMGLTGEPDGLPMRAGAPIADFVGAFNAVIGISLALLHRERTGEGQLVSHALIDGQIAMLANYIPGFFLTGKPDRPVGVGHPQLVPYQLFETSDGFLVIACLTEEFWQRLCVVLGMEGLRDDPRFITNADRVEHRDQLIPIIERAVTTRTSAELSAALDAADVPCAPVHTLADLASHPQVAENEMFVELEQKTVGSYRVVGVPIKLSASPGRIRLPAPELGEHTEEVLAEIGVDANRLEELRELGVVR